MFICIAHAVLRPCSCFPCALHNAFKWVMVEEDANPMADVCIRVKQHVYTAQLLSLLTHVPVAPVSAEHAA